MNTHTIDFAARQRRVMADRLQRVTALIPDRGTDLAAATLKLSPSVYTSAERLDAEMRHVFHKLPQVVGLTQDMPNPGDMLLFDDLGPSVVVTRNAEGLVNAFLNICPHRAAKVVTDCKRRKLLSCRFHGWTFDLNGNLVGMPGEEGFTGLDKSELGLHRIPAVERHGLIFVQLDPSDGEMDIDAFLGPFGPELEQLELHRAAPMVKTRLDVEANWKYALDTYGEGYHFGTLHPETIGSRTLTNIMAYEKLGDHHRLTFGAVRHLDLVGKDREDWPEGADTYSGIHLMFPNTVLNINVTADGQPVYLIYRMYPDGSPHKAYTLLATYAAAGVPADAKPFVDFHYFNETVVRTEDYSVSKDGQNNLRTAPAGFHSILGRNEIALQNHHRKLSELTGIPLSDNL